MVADEFRGLQGTAMQIRIKDLCYNCIALHMGFNGSQRIEFMFKGFGKILISYDLQEGCPVTLMNSECMYVGLCSLAPPPLRLYQPAG